MERKLRQYTQEFKKEVVEYSLSSKKTTEEVARAYVTLKLHHPIN
jgi:transposase-like protein